MTPAGPVRAIGGYLGLFGHFKGQTRNIE